MTIFFFKDVFIREREKARARGGAGEGEGGESQAGSVC